MLCISAALKQGVDHMITFLVTLSITQTLLPGRLGGAGHLPAASRATVFQRADQPARSGRSDGSATPASPAAAYSAQITDPVLRSAQGSAQLAQTTRREANVRGFNDVFTLSGWLAIGFLCWLLLLSLRTAVLKQWRPPVSTAATPAASR